MVYQKYRKIAKEMIMSGVKAADPVEAIKTSIVREGNIIKVQGDEFDLDNFDQILFLGIGKAVTQMGQAMEEIIIPDQGLLITKLGQEIGESKVKSVPVLKAYHPEPRKENVQHTERLLKMVEGLDSNHKTLIFFFVTGGGSALFCAPPEGISIDDMYKLNQLFMKCGASIYDINTIRKHLSQVKGGSFAQLCAEKGATVISLILSDVVGDDLSIIASGPTYKDNSTFADAVSRAKYYGIWKEMPGSIRDYLKRGLDDKEMETPAKIPETVHNYLIGNNMRALKAAEEVAKKSGFNTMVLTSQNTGEARVIAKCITGIAKEIQDSGHPISPPAALIIGGEMIVTFDWEDRDGFGPNREFVLSSSIELADRENIVIAGADTDGVDGEGKSGAIADCRTLHRAELNAREYLDKHEAEAFFDSLGDSLEFQSFTNVNDIVVVLIGPCK